MDLGLYLYTRQKPEYIKTNEKRPVAASVSINKAELMRAVIVLTCVTLVCLQRVNRRFKLNAADFNYRRLFEIQMLCYTQFHLQCP